MFFQYNYESTITQTKIYLYNNYLGNKKWNCICKLCQESCRKNGKIGYTDTNGVTYKPLI